MAASARRGGRAMLLLLGAVWALPLSAPMLLLALLSWPFGARFSTRGPMLVVTHFEPPRLSRRLRTLRGLEHEQIGEVRTRGA
jgi:hypothetical protein